MRTRAGVALLGVTVAAAIAGVVTSPVAFGGDPEDSGASVNQMDAVAQAEYDAFVSWMRDRHPDVQAPIGDLVTRPLRSVHLL